jgi:putative ABC transport system substrate-binding protein
VAREHADALLLLLDPIFTANARRIVEVATRNHLPTVYGLRQFTDAGGLLGYGASTAEALRLVASYVDISKHVGHVNGYSSVIDEMAA